MYHRIYSRPLRPLSITLPLGLLRLVLCCMFQSVSTSFSLLPSLSMCLSVSLSVSLSMIVSLSVSVCLHEFLLVSRSLYLCLSISVCLAISFYMSMYQSVSICPCLPVCLSYYVRPLISDTSSPAPCLLVTQQKCSVIDSRLALLIGQIGAPVRPVTLSLSHIVSVGIFQSQLATDNSKRDTRAE